MIARLKSSVFAAAILVVSLGAAVLPAYAQSEKKIIYSDTADAKADIAAAITQAKAEHKNIILDFGGNWCGDCQVLDIYFHQEPNSSIVAKSFVIVHVNIGRYDKNTDVAEKYGVPLKKGVPGLAVLDSTGKLLYSQKNGEFEAMRSMDPKSVSTFLNQWKPKA